MSGEITSSALLLSLRQALASVQTCPRSRAYLVAFSPSELQAKRPNINPAPAASHPDPFNRKSVRKPQKGTQKKQQGSSKFRTKPNFEIQPLGLLKGE